ncbi:glycosyltransferase [Pseudopontixanthobacter vadosimaris]|uniref:glycosyltransferase n=1 Tax=Pseudopontixanthobacter vadosimaris TaxID=2726450 RepID=UPI0014729B1E
MSGDTAPAATRRLLSISTLYPNRQRPRFGSFVARSLEALARHEAWEVTVINPIGVPPIAMGRYRALKEAAVDGMENGIPVHRPVFPLLPRIGGRINPAMIARSILPLARRLHAETPFDMVDAQFFYPDGPAAERIARALDLPLAIKARGGDIHFWGGKRYARKAMMRSAGTADLLLAVCGALAEDMRAIGIPPDRTALHYTGLDHDRFRPLDHAALRRRIAAELGIDLPGSAPWLATVGALVERKGQQLVLSALEELPAAHLLLVGEGPDEATFRRQAARQGLADRVHFLGSVDHDVLPLLLSAADIMVLPSASEGLANAWIEALACGTPIVISDVGGAREVVTGRDAGLIVERDARSIAAGVQDLLAALPTADAAAAAARRFSWRENARMLARYYDAAVTGTVKETLRVK